MNAVPAGQAVDLVRVPMPRGRIAQARELPWICEYSVPAGGG
jgi:hypothetical protein